MNEFQYYIKVSLKNSNLSLDKVKYIIDNFIEFDIDRYRDSKFKSFGKFNKFKLDLYDETTRFKFWSKDRRETFALASVVGEKPYLSLIWQINEERDISFIDKLATLFPINTAYCCDYLDQYTQSATLISDYEVKGLPYKHHPKFYNDFMDEFYIDISNNPGRSTNKWGFHFMSCWRMWYGNNFFDIFSRGKLLTFEGAHIKKEIDSDIVFFELYPSPNNATCKKNRALQLKFRKHVMSDWDIDQTKEE